MPRVKYPFVFMFVASIYVCAMCMCHLASASHIKVNQATPEIEENLTGRQPYRISNSFLVFIQMNMNSGLSKKCLNNFTGCSEGTYLFNFLKPEHRI